MVGGILFLAIVIFGLLVLFGHGKIENYLRFLILLIFAPLLLAIGYNHALWFWYGLPLWLQILSILLVPFLISAILKFAFPKAKWLQDLQTVVFSNLDLCRKLFRFALFGGQVSSSFIGNAALKD